MYGQHTTRQARQVGRGVLRVVHAEEPYWADGDSGVPVPRVESHHQNDGWWTGPGRHHCQGQRQAGAAGVRGPEFR